MQLYATCGRDWRILVFHVILNRIDERAAKIASFCPALPAHIALHEHKCTQKIHDESHLNSMENARMQNEMH